MAGFGYGRVCWFGVIGDFISLGYVFTSASRILD